MCVGWEERDTYSHRDKSKRMNNILYTFFKIVHAYYLDTRDY